MQSLQELISANKIVVDVDVDRGGSHVCYCCLYVDRDVDQSETFGWVIFQPMFYTLEIHRPIVRHLSDLGYDVCPLFDLGLSHHSHVELKHLRMLDGSGILVRAAKLVEKLSRKYDKMFSLELKLEDEGIRVRRSEGRRAQFGRVLSDADTSD